MDLNLDEGGKTELGSKETCRIIGTSVGTVASKEDSLKCSQNSTFNLRPAKPEEPGWPTGALSTKLQF